MMFGEQLGGLGVGVVLMLYGGESTPQIPSFGCGDALSAYQPAAAALSSYQPGATYLSAYQPGATAQSEACPC